MKTRLGKILAATPFALLLGLLGLVYLGPMASLIGKTDLASIRSVASSPSLPKSIRFTLLSGVIGALGSVVLGSAFAYVFARIDWRFKRMQRLLLLLPYLVPNFILASAYVLAWNPRSGLLNSLLRFPGGLYGWGGMSVLFAVVHLPVAFLLLEEKVRRIESSWIEAARISGASKFAIFFEIELPILIPSLLSSFGLCFSLNASAFAIPAWIGAPAKNYTLAYKIYQSIQIGGAESIPEAGAYAIALLILCSLFLALSGLSARSKIALVSGKASRPAMIPPNPARFRIFQCAYWLYQAVAWIAPLGALALTTIVPPGCIQKEGLACLAHPSFRSYSYVLFELADSRAAFHGSFVYGSLAAVVALAVSVVSLLILHKRGGFARVAEWIFSVPLSTPGAVIALGLIVCASGRFGFNLYNTAWIAVLAYVIKHTSLSFQPLKAAIGSVSGSLTEAARISGAGPVRTWAHIVLPILRPELLGGFFLILIPVLGELTMSIFLTSPTFQSVGTVLFDLQDYADQSSAAALSMVLVVAILLMNKTARILSRGKLGY